MHIFLIIALVFFSCSGQPEMEQTTISTPAQVNDTTVHSPVSGPTDTLSGETETLILTFNAIASSCAQWSESKYDRRGTEKRIRYWLEPANADLPDADGLFDGEHLPLQIKVTGKLISEHGFPKKRLEKAGEEEAGKVFRYTRIEVIRNGVKKHY